MTAYATAPYENRDGGAAMRARASDREATAELMEFRSDSPGLRVARRRIAMLLTGRGLSVNRNNLESLLVNAYIQGLIDATQARVSGPSDRTAVQPRSTRENE